MYNEIIPIKTGLKVAMSENRLWMSENPTAILKKSY